MDFAGFWKRFGAMIIDAFILMIPGLMAGGVFRYLFAGIALNVLLGFLYYPFFESSEMSATPGKALMGIAVVTEAGGRLTFKAALIRYFGHYLSVLVCYIGFLMQVFTSKRQTLHDMISESVVINRQSADVNYFTVWKDQFKSVLDKL